MPDSQRYPLILSQEQFSGFEFRKKMVSGDCFLKEILEFFTKLLQKNLF